VFELEAEEQLEELKQVEEALEDLVWEVN
jgi:hypothetical protein